MVRLICSETGELGDNLRELWKTIYRGDLKWGVRDARFEAKNFPPRGLTSRKDRNSWVAAYLKKYIADIVV